LKVVYFSNVVFYKLDEAAIRMMGYTPTLMPTSFIRLDCTVRKVHVLQVVSIYYIMNFSVFKILH